MGDVTYGACCVDDLSARAMGCDYLLHYGHSCLVPVTADDAVTTTDDVKLHLRPLRTLYIFVEIGIDTDHLVACAEKNFGDDRSTIRLVLMGTIQFTGAVHEASISLKSKGFNHVEFPQAKPLSAGETLGCTSPRLDYPVEPSTSGGSGGRSVLLFVADGRFHLESAMIHNPELEAYRYDPYGKAITRERYDTPRMMALRYGHIQRAQHAKRWGVVLGTLGRQGNPAIVKHVRTLLTRHGRRHVVVLLSEVFPAKLALFRNVDAWVQVACPRLSIDWGEAFDKPVLTPYETMVAFGEAEWRSIYPMDYYAKDSGPWTNPYHASREG
uniref:2-(3-amino-3-carboxypropyl)histidine synthase subunit 1 n=1 Tax=Octactis speculum TaxID=3111310 RepID=A0A7S2HTH3_9STRA|mmetsp:Transcript_9279/g.11957  ORF Transcript_9279/g.11957 Transcript_9279/m.11957 type:complete len:326 (+) Transcript_9279:2-979(+)|eukprot:CAMPEP_0185751302 /NCGR_PEP_ID=MMETSP1174-20130828/10063_1 /TAXON_ID=35687 /ORGANISM="Dictyocha speculum, Strain CCMP1381" /LENGTH=325 /DNA_ID=CAMNT_0028428207 /DNA_START=1 /DNA_END=978 /DNA_ORIENTATION=+